MMGDFERELENELHRVIDPLLGSTIPQRRVESGGTMKRLLGGAGVAVGLKILTGIVAAAAAITVAGAVTEVATNNGSFDPGSMGISQQVQTCKDALRASGTRGIGQCVSAIARHHGHGAAAHASGARTNGNGNDKDHGQGSNNGKGNSNTNGKGHGKPSGAPSGPPSGAPHGQPSTLPEH